MTEAKPSKSERKREALAFKALAERLLDLGDDEVGCLGLDERVTEAVAAARRMKSREALRRQKQFIGKLLMNTDTVRLRDFLEGKDASERRQRQHFHKAERWRDDLVRDGGAALERFERATGAVPDELRHLLDALDDVHSDREEKGIRKAIFRAVYDALGDEAAASVAARADDR